MLIWLGVVGTVLVVVGMGVLYAVFLLIQESRESRNVVLKSAAEQSRQYQEWDRASELWIEKIRSVFSEGGKVLDSHAEKILNDWKYAASSFTKSEQELADNLAALLREVKVSKAFAVGSVALVEQNVAAVDKLWQMFEMIRRGPRTATNLAPSDEEIAAREKGSSADQQAAIDGMLANARERMLNNHDDLA